MQQHEALHVGQNQEKIIKFVALPRKIQKVIKEKLHLYTVNES